MPRAASPTAARRPFDGPRGMIVSVSPTTAIAPTAAPERSKIVPARLDSPSTASSRSTGDRGLANRLELGAEGLGRQCTPGQLRQALGNQIVDQLSRRVGEDRLAESACVDWELCPDLEHLKGGVRAEHVMDDDHARPVHDADTYRGGGALGQALRLDDRATAKLVQIEIGVAQMQKAGAELVLLGLAVLLDEPVRLERLERPMDRRAGDAEPVGKLADPSLRGPLASARRIRAARSTD